MEQQWLNGKGTLRFNWFPLPQIYRQPAPGRLVPTLPLPSTPHLGILPAVPPSVVLPTQVLPPRHLNPSCSGSIRIPGETSPRWRGGQAGGSSTFSTVNNQQPTTHVPWWREAWFWGPSGRLTDRLVNYLLTEKREGKPWKYTSGELPWNNKSNQKLKPRNETFEKSKLWLKKQIEF